MNLQKSIFLLVVTTLTALVALFVFSCQSAPKNIFPVTGFNYERYLGKWYEIARFDFTFEKDMENVTAYYSKNQDGSIRVENRGYNYKQQEWKESIGKAKFRKSPEMGALKVSFFGPFYSDYNIIALDSEYQYALVAGKNYNYLWILSRTNTIPEEVKQDYLVLAESIGFDTSKLVWTKQTD
ncbi:MAG: lipocalin family protein [Spirochaetaceae bacterium]|nr:lipocalin family protein [Spirochaetaceae bacterium]